MVITEEDDDVPSEIAHFTVVDAQDTKYDQNQPCMHVGVENNRDNWGKVIWDKKQFAHRFHPQWNQACRKKKSTDAPHSPMPDPKHLTLAKNRNVESVTEQPDL